MSLAQLTPSQLRVVQLVCFLLPIACALVLSVVAKKRRKHVRFRFVDRAGAPLAGVVSTVVGAGAREKVRAIGRLDARGVFDRTFTPFEPRMLRVTMRDGGTATFGITVANVRDDHAVERPITLTPDDEGGVIVRASETT